jgi:hypothetical protein
MLRLPIPVTKAPNCDKVKDPCRKMVSAYTKYLHWYLVYRTRNLTEDETPHLDVKGDEVLRTLVSVLPHHGVTLSDATFRSAFCEKKIIPLFTVVGTIASWVYEKTTTLLHQRPGTRRPRGRHTRPIIIIQ